MRTTLAFVLLVTWVAGCAGGPGPTPPGPRPPSGAPQSASLLRRIAEAADGFRDGLDKYVVVNRTFPHEVLGVFSTLDSADTALARKRASDGAAYATYDVFGPFRTVEDPPFAAEDSTEEVLHVIVVTRKGEKRFDGREIDAIFWGLPAFDKFIAPYLAAIGGAAYAAKEREDYRLGRSRLAHSYPIVHYRTSF